MRKQHIAVLFSLSLLFPAAAYAAPVHGPDAEEAPYNKPVDKDHGALPQSCMVVSDNILCSATIISKNVALTAAHCAGGFPAVPVKLYCGGNRVEYKGTLEPNEKYVYKVSFEPKFLSQDYAYISLSKKKEFNAEPMPLAPSDQWPVFSDPEQNECRVVGWGGDGKGPSGRLFSAPVTEIAYEETDPSIIMFGHKGGNANGIDGGDSGGSLMCKVNGAWNLIGILVANGKGNVGAAVNVMDWK